MSDQWYYAKEEQQHGPVDFARLQELVTTGQLLATDVVWKAGMMAWLPAAEIPGLLSKGPPPLPAAKPSQPPRLADDSAKDSAAALLAQAEQKWQAAEDHRLKQDFDRAIALATEVIQLAPQAAPAYFTRAESYRQKRDFARAIADATEAIRLEPAAALAYLSRAESYREKRDFDRAIADANEAIRLEPATVPAYLSRAESYREKQDFDRAMADANEAIQRVPHPFCYTIRAELYLAKDDLDRAIADATEAVRRDPDNTSLTRARLCLSVGYRKRAQSHLDKQNFDRAIADATEALQLRRVCEVSFGIRAESYRLKSDFDRAIADATEAIRLSPNYAFAFATRAESYRCKGQYDLAIADATEAIRLRPNNAFALQTRAQCYLQKGDYGRAIADATEAIRLNPKNGFTYATRADCYRLTGNYDAVIADATEAIQLTPQRAIAFWLRADAYWQKKNYERAIADATEAIRLNPGLALAYCTRAECYREKMDLSRAIADATEAARLDPSNSRFSQLLSQIQEEVKRRNASRPKAATAPVPTAAAKPTTAPSLHTHSKQVGDPDGCGPCTKCGHIFQMYFANAVCPKCKHKMSREEAFFSCGSYPHSTPPDESTSGTTLPSSPVPPAREGGAAPGEQSRPTAFVQAMLNQHQAQTGSGTPTPAPTTTASPLKFYCPSCVTAWQGKFREGDNYECRCGAEFPIKRHLGEMQSAKALGFLWTIIGEYVCTSCSFQGEDKAFILLGSKESEGRIVRGTERRLITMLYECPKCHCTMHHSFLNTYMDLL